jgi:inorganic pyrophosphatase
MPRITVAVEATIGSTIGPARSSAEEPMTQGWPVGRGWVPDTLDEDADPVEALVLMPEPAVGGVWVRAWPVAVLHLTVQDRPEDDVVCVADDPACGELVAAGDLAYWCAEPDAWTTALARLSPGPMGVVTGYGPREEAEALLAQAHRAYERLTGCLD